MNTTKAEQLIAAKYGFSRSAFHDDADYIWTSPEGAKFQSQNYQKATDWAHEHFIAQQEALEAQRQQAADDLAGQEAYEEVKAEAAEPEGYMHPCENCIGSGVVKNGTWSLTCPDCDGTGIYQENEDETAQLRQQVGIASSELQSEISKNQELRAENEALKAENGLLLAGNDGLRKLLAHVAYEISGITENINPLKRDDFRAIASGIRKALEGTPAPLAQAEASEVVAAKPKKAIPARMRVNWNQRGFSSGSYEVLGYSHEKQCYMLNISTDDTRPMLKAVKMADCLAVQS